MKSQLKLVGESDERETSRHRQRRHPSRWGSAHAERLHIGYRYYYTRGRIGRGHAILVVARKGHSTSYIPGTILLRVVGIVTDN